MVGRVQEDTVQYPFLGNLLVETLHVRESHGEKRRSVTQPTTVETFSTQFNGLLRRFLQLPNVSRGPSLIPAHFCKMAVHHWKVARQTMSTSLEQ